MITIGIVGYGMVGKTIADGFNDVNVIIVDPQHSTTTIEELCASDAAAIFVCVPTPASEPTFETLTSTLDRITATGFAGLVVVKSTVLPQYIEKYDVIYNPEFLSRSTALADFLYPPYVVIAGNRSGELITLYRNYTSMDLSNVYVVDLATASFIKYTANTFFALKVTFMNEMKKAADEMGADYYGATSILKTNPSMGDNHFMVPGPDGEYGFGGPCLPKDTETFLRHFHSELLSKAVEINNKIR